MKYYLVKADYLLFYALLAYNANVYTQVLFVWINCTTLRIRTLLATTFDVLVTTYHGLHMCRKHFLLTKSVKSANLF